jgi:hypothetical protein
VTIINTYAPTNEKELEGKQDFYDQLQATVEAVPKKDLLIVMGDVHAKIGKDNSGKERIMGQEGLGQCNENGELFTDFCLENKLVIRGSIFKCKNIHKITWISPNQKVCNQTDHITIRREWRRFLLNVRAYTGADVMSDHFLVRTTLKIKLMSRKRVGMGRTKYRTETLQTKEKKNEYRLKLQNRLEVLNKTEDFQNIEEIWQTIKDTYNKTAEVLGIYTKQQGKWIPEQTWKNLEERKILRRQILKTTDTQKKEQLIVEYKDKDKQVKRSARRDKRNQLQETVQQAEEAAKQNDMRELYRITRELSDRKINVDKPVKDKQGNH